MNVFLSIVPNAAVIGMLDYVQSSIHPSKSKEGAKLVADVGRFLLKNNCELEVQPIKQFYGPGPLHVGIGINPNVAVVGSQESSQLMQKLCRIAVMPAMFESCW
jgi:hypothetical protein